jgi:hypothetical protein
MASAKPSKQPVADMSVLVNAVDALSRKAGLGPLGAGALKLPLWKRWIEGAGPEYDAVAEGGLRPVINANALYADAMKADLDLHGQAILELRADVQALKEAPAARPFP